MRNLRDCEQRQRALEALMTTLRAMKVGESFAIDRRLMGDFFGDVQFSPDADTARDALLNKLPGSSWGEFLITEDPCSGNVIVSRCKGSDRRVYVSADRRHLFRRLADGRLEPTGEA